MIAGILWSIAGGMLIFKGISLLLSENFTLITLLITGIAVGVTFYFLLFSRISLKHINRIFRIDIIRPCFFSFFSPRSYVLMTIMISTGLILRKLDIINHEVLGVFYISMGTPLLISSLRFYYSWIKYKSMEIIYKNESDNTTNKEK